MPYSAPKWKRSDSGAILVHPVEVARSYQAPQAEAVNKPSPAIPPTVQKEQNKQPSIPEEKQPEAPADANRIDISHPAKIYTLSAPNKFLHFTSKLVKAYPKDYAMIHGCGGQDHAPNSTIGLQLCDYSNGKGKSITVKANLDAEEIPFFFQAALNARLGQLQPKVVRNDAALVAAQQKLNLLTKRNLLPDGNIPISPNELTDLLNDLASVNPPSCESGYEGFPYCQEKNDCRKETDGYIPVTKLFINYSPVYQGKVNNYPWYICIENFWAPTVRNGNGIVSHDSSKARDKKYVSINVSQRDFLAAMTRINGFIREWEHRSFATIDSACSQAEASQQKWREENRNK